MKQAFVDGIFRSVDDAYDVTLRPEWVAVLERLVAPMRYPAHGLQMVASYVGSMAPGGRVVVCSLFTAADEMRRIQIVAYRMRQLQRTYPGFGKSSKTTWETDAAWQPLREVIERLLVTYDLGEALVALSLVVKPAIDELLVARLARCARLAGDDVLAKLLDRRGLQVARPVGPGARSLAGSRSRGESRRHRRVGRPLATAGGRCVGSPGASLGRGRGEVGVK